MANEMIKKTVSVTPRKNAATPFVPFLRTSTISYLYRMNQNSFNQVRRAQSFAWLVLAAVALWALASSVSTARADEICSSPYLARIEGQEELLYVWTLGVEGLGDGADKLVTMEVKPGSANYGKVIHGHSLGGRLEAHHGGFTDDRRLVLADARTLMMEQANSRRTD
jgi:hypothetical protein